MKLYQTLPSDIVYSVDIPEISNLSATFFYNYYVPDEAVNDKWFSDQDFFTKKNVNFYLSNPSQDVIKQLNVDMTSEDAYKTSKDLQRLPRYVKLTFTPTILSNDSTLSQDNIKSLFEKIKTNSFQIVSEEQFSKSRFIPVNIDNGKIQRKVSSLFKDLLDADDNNDLTQTSELTFSEVNKKVIDNALSLQLKLQGNDVTNKNVNQYFESFKKVRFDSQINKNCLYDLFVQASGSYHFNNDFFLQQLNYSKAIRDPFYNPELSEDSFKPNIPYYQKEITSGDYSSVRIIGYSIEKNEIFSDGTSKTFPAIFLPGSKANGYIDFDIKYASSYVYKIRSIAIVTYNVPEDGTIYFSIASSLVASKPVMTYTETVENIAPPPPAELRIIWDFDRVNPLTAIVDHETGNYFPGTGIKGSLMLCWSYPVNTQMDIKKFQVFRRKSINDPFELIKVFDFNDSLVKFQDLETSINKSLISNVKDPLLRFYDDDFYKNSEYIYSVASVDAHGLTSNYSEQFKVKFDSFKNKIDIDLVSISGAPKQYPNMYLEKDLFVDTIKSSNKKTLNLYFTPTCYEVSSNGLSKKVVYFKNASDKTYPRYLANFINFDNQKFSNLEIVVNGLPSNQELKIKKINK